MLLGVSTRGGAAGRQDLAVWDGTPSREQTSATAEGEEEGYPSKASGRIKLHLKVPSVHHSILASASGVMYMIRYDPSLGKEELNYTDSASLLIKHSFVDV